MSLAIVIGSEIEDLHNIEDTVQILKFTKEIIGDNKLSLPDQEVFDSDRLDNIISWYTGIHSILTDPLLGSTEEDTHT